MMKNFTDMDRRLILLITSFFLAGWGFANMTVMAEGTGESLMLAKENAKPFVQAVAVPPGQADFVVEMPRPRSTVVVSVADFGASPENENNTQAFNDALTAARETKAAKLIVPKGIYRFAGGPSISLSKLSNLEFDGQGSEFIFSKKTKSLFSINDCDHLLLKNFFVDWDWASDPLASVVRLDAINKEDGFLDLTFIHYQKFPLEKVRVATLDALDPQTMSVGREQGPPMLTLDFVWAGKAPGAPYEWLGDNQIRLRMPNQNLKNWLKNAFAPKAKPGDFFRMRHYVYELGGFKMDNNSHLTFSNVTVYSTPGFGFHASGLQHHWQLLNTHLIPRPGTKRPITSTADGLHSVRTLGYFKMDGCDFSFMGDDCLNIYDQTCIAVKSGTNSITTKYSQKGLPRHFQPGDAIELRQTDYAPTGFRAPLQSLKSLPGGACEITFAQPVPEPSGEGFVVCDWRYNSEHIIIRNSSFHENQARALLLSSRNITVENNRFFHNHIGVIQIMAGYTHELWCEGYGSSNIVIRNNLFEAGNPAGERLGWKGADIIIGVYLKTDPSEEKTSYPILKDILIESNTFLNSAGAIAYVTCASNVILRGNKISITKSREENLPFRGSIFTDYASDLKIINNIWTRSAWLKNPGVFAVTNSTSGILFEGNSVVEK